MPIRNTFLTESVYSKPLGYWRLNETSGVSANDASPNNRDGAINGTVSAYASGGWSGDGDTAITFATAGDVRIAASGIGADARQPFSFMCAVRPTTVSILQTLLHDGAGYLAISAANKFIFGQFGSTLVTGTTTVVVATYYFVIGTYDGLTLRLYVNGASQGTPTAFLFTDPRGTLYAGRRSGSAAGLDGRIDEVAWWDRVLNAAEISNFFASRNITVQQASLKDARSAWARSGATRSDRVAIDTLFLTIAGVARANRVWDNTLVVRKEANDQPDSATFTVWEITPVAGQEVIIGTGSINRRVFAGVILSVVQQSVRGNAGTPAEVIHTVNCADWSFVLAKTRVLKKYTSQAAHLIFLDLVTNYSSGFTTANVVTSSPTIDEITFDLSTTLPAALTRLANRANMKWYVDAAKDFHFFVTETAQAPAAITATNLLYDALDVEQRIDQIRTRALIEGGGGQTTAPVAVGASSIPVDECVWYAAAGGTIVVGQNRLTYTGRSVASGPGNITGIPTTGANRILFNVGQGEKVNVLAVVDDTAAQTALAALNPVFGDGVYEFYAKDERLSLASAIQRGQAELTLFKSTLKSGGFVTRDRFADVGKSVTITLPNRGHNFSVPIQGVEIKWLNPNKTQRICRFDSAVQIDLADVVRSMVERG